MYKKRGKKHPPIILNPLYSLEKVEYSLDNVDAHVAPSATSPRIHGKYSNMLTVPPISTDKKAADVTLVKKQPELKEKTVQINYRKALEPKVMCPFETKEGVTPRKIEIERLKRQFATQNLQQILLQKLAALELPHSPKNLLELLNDNDHANGISAEGMLPLHLFDNSLFDCRTVDDWLDMSMIPDEQVGDRVLLKAELRHPEYPNLRQAIVPLPAKAFDSVEWRDCIAVCYDESREMWKVKWRSYNGYNLEKIAKNAGNVYVHPEDIDIDAQNKKCDPRVAIEGTEMWVYRIHVMFLAESVQHFADRKRAFCVDCMPLNHLLSIPPEKLDHFVSLATSSRNRFKNLLQTDFVQNLIDDYQTEFKRANNQLIFEKEIAKLENIDLLPVQPEPPKLVPLFGKVVAEHLNFEEKRNEFEFSTWMSKIETIQTMSKVRVECDKVASTLLFSINTTKTVKLDEFEQFQLQNLQAVKTNLKERLLFLNKLDYSTEEQYKRRLEGCREGMV